MLSALNVFFVLGRCTTHKGDALGYDGRFGEGKVEASSPRPIVVVKVEREVSSLTSSFGTFCIRFSCDIVSRVIL